jgi:amidohydrolase
MLKIIKDDWLKEATRIRRDLHQIPEEGLEEFKTRDYILSYLKDLHIPVMTTVYETAVVAIIGEGGSAVAFRADMDALKVTEETEVPFKSTHSGMMHACGHDGHMTILLLFARYLSEHKSALKHRVILIFQPAEEGPGGAEGIVKSGLFETLNITKIYGLHLYPALKANRIGIKTGPFMAQTSEFSVIVQGESAHGAQPHRGLDAIVAAAQFVTQLQTIISRKISPLEPAVVTIGKFEAGERVNIIAKKAEMEGTMRSFNPATHKLIQSELLKLGRGISELSSCRVEVVFRDMYPAVINDVQLTQDAMVQLSQHLDMEVMEPHMLAEDFSYYQKAVPGLFFFLGTEDASKGHIHPLHHACFNFDESILVTGLESFAILCFGEAYA